VISTAGPATPLARVQAAWPGAVGSTVAEQADPVAERAGVVRVACRSASWAAELSLMHDELLERLNGRLEGESVRALRFSADGVPLYT
jgi:predicted nucleic acid-binding Zn ribbon protein